VAKFQYVGTWGYYSDSSSRNYIRARYFHGGRGNWITEDPIEFAGGLNFYCYVLNSPVLFTDPSGQQNKRLPLPVPPKVPPIFNFPRAPYPTKPPPHSTPGDYGHHCGLYVRTTPPGMRQGDEDCIDSACMQHDRCIDGNYSKCMTVPGYIRKCDDDLCTAAKQCVKKCTTPQCKAQSGKVIAYYCGPFGGSYIKWPGDQWPTYPPIPPKEYPPQPKK
jgi:RHS repeat-associated protein